jgi:Glycosyltransferase
MRILTLNHEYPPIGGGGGQACKDIITDLKARGNEFVLITAYFPGMQKEEVSPHLRILRVFSLRKSPYRVGFLGMGFYILSAISSGLAIIHHWKPDVIHAHFAVPAGAAAYVLHKFTGVPYILTVHLGDVPGGVPEKTQKWFRWIYPFTILIWKNASSVVAVSQFTASLAEQHYSISPQIIPNGIVLKTGKKINTTNHPPQIIFAGRFVTQKNLPAIVDILHSIKDLDWQCNLIGDGPLFQWVKDKIELYGLADRVTLTGWLKPEEVQEFMNHSDILLMPSFTEGLSIVGLQALSYGLAIIATKVGGFNDLVENNENGFLSDVNEVAELGTALRNLLESPSLLLKARRKSLNMAQRFEIGSICDEYENLFKEIIKR